MHLASLEKIAYREIKNKIQAQYINFIKLLLLQYYVLVIIEI